MYRDTAYMTNTEQGAENMEQGYNGWSNRETWALALHLSNDAGWDAEACEAADDFVADDDELSADYRMARWIEEVWAESVWAMAFNGADSSDFCGMVVQDIGSLWRVDFREIASGYVSDARERVSA